MKIGTHDATYDLTEVICLKVDGNDNIAIDNSTVDGNHITDDNDINDDETDDDELEDQQSIPALIFQLLVFISYLSILVSKNR